MAKEKIRCNHCGRLVNYEAKAVKDQAIVCETCEHVTPVEARAVARFVRTAPRKLRLIADSIRGKRVKEALTLLRFTPKRAAHLFTKIVESARANAENTYQMDPENLFISKVLVDGGPTLKRFMPRAMGRAASIRKRTSHITVNVRELNKVIEQKKSRPVSAPVTKKKKAESKEKEQTANTRKKSTAAKKKAK